MASSKQIDDSSVISEEIRDEVDFSGSIPDDIGTMLASGKHQSTKGREAAVSMNKFTNSFISEESQFGISMTGARRAEAAANKDRDLVTESSIQDEISVAGFGGSRSL